MSLKDVVIYVASCRYPLFAGILNSSPIDMDNQFISDFYPW